MPIYDYQCTSCGFRKEVMRKVSEPTLTDCPECGKRTFTKLMSAAGFQLKGGGWYVTDFKNTGTQSKKEPEKTSEGSKSTESKAEAACGTGACPACS